MSFLASIIQLKGVIIVQWHKCPLVGSLTSEIVVGFSLIKIISTLITTNKNVLSALLNKYIIQSRFMNTVLVYVSFFLDPYPNTFQS